MSGTARVLRAICAAVQANRDYLTELDAALGDGDHGFSMAKTFSAVDRGLDEERPPREIIDAAGLVILTSVGGAMGPLFGSAFRAAATHLSQEPVAPSDIASSIGAACDAVVRMGGAQPGDKTMLDALLPAARAAEDAVAAGADAAGVLAAAAAGAEQGAAATADMRAGIGRASRLGERSIGPRDPGAASVSIILTAAAEALHDSHLTTSGQASATPTGGQP